MKKKKLVLIFICLIGFVVIARSQYVILPTGGNASSATGSISYSAGQVTYITYTGINGLAAHGVQQPIEISITQTIELSIGWNMISFYVEPNNMSLLTILDPLVNSAELIKVINEAGGFIQYIPGIGWMNTIGDMANTEGYYIKVNSNTSFDATGMPVSLPMDIPLYSGWNIMGYPTNQPQDAITVLQPLIDNSELIKVINEAGGFIQYIPGIGWMNTIGNFEADEGYYIKVNTNAILIFTSPTQ